MLLHPDSLVFTKLFARMLKENHEDDFVWRKLLLARLSLRFKFLFNYFLFFCPPGTLEFHHYLESSWTPIYKLYRPLSLDARNGSIHIFRYHVTSEQQTAGHVFAVTRITFHHLIGWFKAGIGDFRNAQLFVVSLLGGDHWSVSS